MRGSQVPVPHRALALGSIPASAGQPFDIEDCRLQTTVYPRECGAARNVRIVPNIRHGLSPRVRGSQGAVAKCRISMRSIPASAGQPYSNDQTSGSVKVYPRECGAASCICNRSPRLKGLSPRVRGSLDQLEAVKNFEGSIPASAGQPALPPSSPAPTVVYPRECGAAFFRGLVLFWETGLSPRVRGSQPLA